MIPVAAIMLFFGGAGVGGIVVFWYMTSVDDADAACEICGCTQGNPCPGGCYLVSPGLCSRCAPGLDTHQAFLREEF